MNRGESPDDAVVSGLFSYPVKGCRGNSLLTAKVTTTGLEHDREWMLVDAQRSPAQFLSQRELPSMATIRIGTQPDGGLHASADGQEILAIARPGGSAPLAVRVWNHETVAHDAGDAAAAWFARALSVNAGSVRFVHFDPAAKRECNRTYAGDSGAHTFFADGYPILVTSESSLADLNQRMGRDPASAMPMNRFRPNLVISGLPAWDEDHIDILRIGDIALKFVKPCVRCQVTTTDQQTGSRLSDEPLNTLARFRNNPDLGGVTFGWNAIVLNGGVLSVGSGVFAEYRF